MSKQNKIVVKHNNTPIRTIRVSADDWQRWGELASCEGLTVSAWLRMLAKREDRKVQRAKNGSI